MTQPYGAPGRLSASANPEPAPTDHTAAIAEKAREYVRVLDAWACGEGVSRAAAWYALIAAIDAEREAQSRPDAHPNPQP